MISSKIEHFNKVLGDIEKSIGVTVSDLEKDSLKIKTPLVVYQWHGETSMVNYIGASFILSSGENHYIDDFLNLATRKVIIEDIAPHKKSSEKSNLIESLACLSSIMKSLNIEFSKINDADRLSFNFENKDGIKMYPLWDGERVSFEQKEETPAVLTNPNELGITEESWTKTR